MWYMGFRIDVTDDAGAPVATVTDESGRPPIQRALFYLNSFYGVQRASVATDPRYTLPTERIPAQVMELVERILRFQTDREAARKLYGEDDRK